MYPNSLSRLSIYEDKITHTLTHTFLFSNYTIHTPIQVTKNTDNKKYKLFNIFRFHPLVHFILT